VAFGITKDENKFWNVKEIAYQHVHMFYAFWISYIIFHCVRGIWTPVICGCILGLAMEAYQHMSYIQDEELPKDWVDSLRDLCFWIVGGCLNYIIIFVGC